MGDGERLTLWVMRLPSSQVYNFLLLFRSSKGSARNFYNGVAQFNGTGKNGKSTTIAVTTATATITTSTTSTTKGKSQKEPITDKSSLIEEVSQLERPDSASRVLSLCGPFFSSMYLPHPHLSQITPLTKGPKKALACFLQFLTGTFFTAQKKEI